MAEEADAEDEKGAVTSGLGVETDGPERQRMYDRKKGRGRTGHDNLASVSKE